MRECERNKRALNRLPQTEKNIEDGHNSNGRSCHGKDGKEESGSLGTLYRRRGKSVTGDESSMPVSRHLPSSSYFLTREEQKAGRQDRFNEVCW